MEERAPREAAVRAFNEGESGKATRLKTSKMRAGELYFKTKLWGTVGTLETCKIFFHHKSNETADKILKINSVN